MKATDAVEYVQRTISKIILGLRNLSCKDRPKKLNLNSLDLIEVLKWVKDMNPRSTMAPIPLYSECLCNNYGV